MYRKQTPSSKGDKSAVRKTQVPPSSAPHLPMGRNFTADELAASALAGEPRQQASFADPDAWHVYQSQWYAIFTRQEKTLPAVGDAERAKVWKAARRQRSQIEENRSYLESRALQTTNRSEQAAVNHRERMQEKRSSQEYVDQELQQQREHRADAALGLLPPPKVPRIGSRCERCETLHQTDAFVDDIIAGLTEEAFKQKWRSQHGERDCGYTEEASYLTGIKGYRWECLTGLDSAFPKRRLYEFRERERHAASADEREEIVRELLVGPRCPKMWQWCPQWCVHAERAPRRHEDQQEANRACENARCKAGLCKGAADSCPQEPKCERSKVQAPRMSLADIIRDRREKRELVLQ